MWTAQDEQRVLARIRAQQEERLLEEYINDPGVPRGPFRCTRCGDRTKSWQRGVCDNGDPCLYVRDRA